MPKTFLILLVFLTTCTLFTGCAPAPAPASTADPSTIALSPTPSTEPGLVSFPSPTINPTDTQVVASSTTANTATIEKTPTPAEDYAKYFTKPVTGEDWQLATDADLLAIMKSPLSPLLPPGSKATTIGKIAHNTQTGEAYFTIFCNSKGQVNCAPEAYLRLSKQGIDPRVMVMRYRKPDGSEGRFARYMFDSSQQPWPQVAEYLIAHPTSPEDIQIHIAFSDEGKTNFPYAASLTTQQQGYGSVADWPDTGNVPEAVQNGSLILAP